jgi:hypothetical protein
MTYTDEEKVALFRSILNNIKKDVILNKPKRSVEESARILLSLHKVLSDVIQRKKDLSFLKENKLEGVFYDIIDETMSPQLSDQLVYYCTRDLYENPMAIELGHINIQYRHRGQE